jgi:hypothetical protein
MASWSKWTHQIIQVSCAIHFHICDAFEFIFRYSFLGHTLENLCYIINYLPLTAQWYFVILLKPRHFQLN